MDVMEVMTSLVHKLNNFVFSLRLLDVVDILVVAYLIYRLLLYIGRWLTEFENRRDTTIV